MEFFHNQKHFEKKTVFFFSVVRMFFHCINVDGCLQITRLNIVFNWQAVRISEIQTVLMPYGSSANLLPMFTFLERYLSRMSGKSMPVDLDHVKPFMGFCTAVICQTDFLQI